MSDRYRLKHLFAQGGMAEVYLGVAVGEAGFEKPVAIKRVLPQLAQDSRVSDMFLSEAKLAKFLSHQNVVQVLDVGRSDDGVYMVMELVNGWDLETLLELAQQRGVRFPPALAAFIVSQTLAGLTHAYRRTHEGKPVLSAHRDVSGSNILISSEGEVKVTDFGIARVDGLGNKKTEPGTFKGKIAYAAPEILRTEPANHLSDQFALGVVLFKLLCGRPPFTGEDQWATYYTALQEQTPKPDADLPAPLTQVVLRMLEKVPARRFESPEALARALSAYLASSGEVASSEELATFVQRLHPPAPAAEQLDASVDSVVPTFSLRSQPGSPAAPSPWPMGELELQKDWQPGGPQMDLSGGLDRGAAAKAPQAHCPTCGTPLPAAGATCSACAARKARAEQNAPLELAMNPRSHMQEQELLQVEKPKRFSGPAATFLKRFVVLLVLGGAGFAAYQAVWPATKRASAVGGGMLKIDSEPSGAAILIDGREIGTTPYFAENLYPERAIPFRVVLKGYRPWSGQFTGGKNQALKAVLTRP